MGLVQMGFLGALAGLAIPIIIHLVFGRRTRRVDLGTLRFLKIVLQENVRRRRLKRWILLALRMACVALLVLLFARPYLLAGRLKGDDRLVVILLDRSASMGLKTDRGRLLDLAVAEAEKVVAQCGSATQLEMACFDHAIYPLGKPEGVSAALSNTTESLEDLLTELGSSDTTYGSTDYGAALAWAHDVCVQSECGRKELHLITDLQRSGLDRTDAKPMPVDVKVHLVDLGQPYPRNVAVTRVAAQRLTVRPGETVALEATLLSSGQFALENIPVVLYLRNGDRQQSMRTEVDLDAGATATVQFELAKLAEGLWQGVVMAEINDDLAFDNRRHVALLVTPPLQVVLLDGDPGSSPYTAETYFLAAALRLAPPNESFPDSPFEPKTFPAPGNADLPDLKDADLVVLANLTGLSDADAQRLAKFVSSGGGLLLFGGHNVQAEGYRSLERAGISLGRIVGPQPSGSLPWRLDNWDQTHPIFFPFNDPQYGDLRRLAFRCCTRVEPAEGTDVLGRFRGGQPAILQRRHGRGIMLWFLSACDRDWGNWPRSRLFLPLVHQMLGHLAGLTEGGPVRNVVLDDADSGAGQDAAPGVLDRHTYHEVINFHPRESETDRCSRGELAARFKFAIQAGEDEQSAESLTGAAATADFRQDEVWHWVLLTLMAILFVESFLANRTTI
jgi:hypothetical protein